MASGISPADILCDVEPPSPNRIRLVSKSSIDKLSGRKERSRFSSEDIGGRGFNSWLRRWHMQQNRGSSFTSDTSLPEPTSPTLNKYGDLIDREENRWLREWHMQAQQLHLNFGELTPTIDVTPATNLSKRQEWKQGWPSLLRSCCMVVLALPVWFSANAFVPEISAEYGVDKVGASFITASVNIGFVIATCFVAVFRLSDRVSGNSLVILGSLACGLFSVVMVMRPPWPILLLARGFTGAALSLVYPTLVKHLSTWFRALRGLAIGCMIGSFTVGVAIPSLVKVLLPAASWQMGVLAPSILTLGAAILALFMQDGPNATKAAEVSAKAVLGVFCDPLWNYVTIAYVGHSFELFGGWAYMGKFLQAYFEEANGESDTLAPAVTFTIIASGFFGCVVAGYCADRFSRSSILLITNIVSGCSITALPFLRDAAPQWLVLTVAGLWGISVNADSALYSALVTEVVSNKKVVGTALTLSIACGFVMTAAAIFVVPVIVSELGWNFAFTSLGCGPLLSVLATLRLNVKMGQSAQEQPAREPKRRLPTQTRGS